MLRISADQRASLDTLAQQRFAERLIAHLERSRRDGDVDDSRRIAERAMVYAASRTGTGEDDVAALAEILQAIESRRLTAMHSDWVEGIFADQAGGKARRLRECFAIELRIGSTAANPR